MHAKMALIFYCIASTCPRKEQLVPGMHLVTQTLGKEVWNHAIIVLTYANNVKPKREYLKTTYVRQLGTESEKRLGLCWHR